MSSEEKDKKDKKSVPEKVDPKKKVKYQRFVLKKFRISVSIGGYGANTVIRIPCDKKTGKPKSRYWRKRLRDAQVDNCIVAVASS